MYDLLYQWVSDYRAVRLSGRRNIRLEHDVDVQADWKSSLTYGRAPNAIDIS